MAVSVASIAKGLWTGLAGDTKPTDSRVSPNDVYLETDTGNYFVYTGAAWAASFSKPPLKVLI